MLSASEVHALSLRGLTYWRVNGKDLALDLKNIENKRDTLTNLGIDLIVKDKVIILQPSAMRDPYIDTLTALPLVIDRDTLKRVSYTKARFDLIGNGKIIDPDCVHTYTDIPTIKPDTIHKQPESDIIEFHLPSRVHVLDLTDAYICPVELDLISSLSTVADKILLGSTLDRPDITSLEGLFWFSDVDEVDFTDFRGTYITSIYRLFAESNCSKITWNKFDMSNIKTAKHAFEGARNLRSINLSTMPNLDEPGIFCRSALHYPYIDSMLASGELQAWCRKRFT